MTDLVTRLYESDAASALTNEAAREIERLRETVAAARDWDDASAAYIERLRARIADFEATSNAAEHMQPKEGRP